MAAPTLQAEGTLAAVTTGNLTVTLPAHLTDDVLVVNLVGWVPNTAGSAAGVTAPAGWTEIAEIPTPSGTADGQIGLYWKRAASGAEANPTFTRPAGWDTGTDGVWSGRAYVIRGCETSGDPWDAVATSAVFNTANQACAAVTVSGSERMVVQFQGLQDNLAPGTISGWTAGTAVTDTTGTDSGFKTHRKDNVASSTTADASTAVAPAQGFYAFIGVSFKPPAAAIHITGSGSPVATLSPTASGTAVQTFNASGSPVKTLSSTASGTAVQKFNASGSPVATLSSFASGSTAVQTFNASGSPLATLSATAAGTATMTPDAPAGFTGSGSPVATLSPTATGAASEIFNAAGSPVKTLSATASGAAVQTFNASGSPVATLSATASGAAVETFNASSAAARRLSAFASGAVTSGVGPPPPPLKKKARGRLIITDDAPVVEPVLKKEQDVIEANQLADVVTELPEYEAFELAPIRWNPKTNRPGPVEEVIVDEIDDDEDFLLQILAVL